MTVLERAEPLAVRRLVSFAEAVRAGTIEVEGVRARLVTSAAEARETAEVAVLLDPDLASVAALAPWALLDGRMSKRPPGPRPEVPFVVALGPGARAGVDVDAVVETQRGPDLGRVIWVGSAEPDSAVPAAVVGFTEKRVLRAPRAGRFRGLASIGDVVVARQPVGEVAGAPVVAAIAGLVRGLLADGVEVAEGTKVGDVDPRGPGISPSAISDKARTVAAGVLEAVLLAARRA